MQYLYFFLSCAHVLPDKKRTKLLSVVTTKYPKIQDTDLQIYKKTTNHNELVVFIYSLYG